MNVVQNPKTKTRFLSLFNGLGNKGFSAKISFVGDQVGFGIQKPYPQRKEVSILKVAILDSDNEIHKVYVDATFGIFHPDRNSIEIRNSEQIKFSDPIDIQSSDDYKYDATNNQLSKAGKNITGLDLITEMYSKHVKPTKKIRGFYLRGKLWFWRIGIKTVLEMFSKLLSAVLYTISGAKYKYDPFWPEEEQDRLNTPPQVSGSYDPSKKIDLFGYKASQWAVLFYCLIHLAVFIFCYTYSFYPMWAIYIMKNNFLTVVYVIASLWFIESVLPKLFVFLIKKLLNLSMEVQFRKIKV